MQITAPSANTITTPAATIQPQTLTENDFLQLLSAQLSSQDPTNPTDSSEFVTQLASVSSLQAMTSLNTNFTGFSSGQDAASAPGYLGKQVTATDASGNPVTGIATAVGSLNGASTVTINGTAYPLTSVTTVALPPN